MTCRLLKKGFNVGTNRGVLVHQSHEPARVGFWDQRPISLPSLAGLVCEVEAELASLGGLHSSLAHVQGHVGSGAMSVALDTANKLLSTGFWSQAVYVELRV